MKKQSQPEALQSTADLIAEKLAPFWGRLSSVPHGVPIQAAVALGGRVPWYAEAAVDPPTPGTEWSGRVVLIADDVFVVMTRESTGESEARTVAVTQAFRPVAVRLSGEEGAWQDIPGNRPPGTADIEFVFKDASSLTVPMAVGSLRVAENDEALWTHFFAILDRLKS
jgi:hypothetical protein